MLKFKNVKINLINFFSILKSFNSSQFILNDFFFKSKTANYYNNGPP